MLPGKKYTPDDLLLILRRRYWFVLVPFAVISAGVSLYARYLPDMYRSEAFIVVVPPQVPETIVRPTVTSLADRLPAFQQQISSRTRLERVIQDLNLYPMERRSGMLMEDVVDMMRRQIRVDPVRGDAFRVSFTGRDPRTVQRVTERLSSLFMDESMRDREVLVQGTDQFLEAQVEEARQKLIDHEKKLEAYRRTFGNELPTQLESNIQASQNLQMQLQGLLQTIDRDQERRTLLERQLAELESQPTAIVAPAAPGAAQTTEQQLNAARAQLLDMQITLRPEHPDVQRMKRLIRDLEQKLDAEMLEAPVSAGSGRAGSTAEQQRQRRLDDLRTQIAQLGSQIERNQAEVERARKAVAEYQRRADAAPTRETELVELNRDYGTLQATYAGLRAQKERSNITTSIESRQLGERFNLVDPARVPQRPFSPDRSQYNVMGMAAGLGVGLALIALLEFRDATFTTDEELSRVLGMPVLAVVPLMLSKQERRARAFRRSLVAGSLGTIVLGCLAVLAYTFVR
jgi:polysaccharide chain length determinant protein (PEP-CTERM system associated)